MQAAGRASFATDTPSAADLHRSMLNPVAVFSHMPAAVRRSLLLNPSPSPSPDPDPDPEPSLPPP